MWLQQSSEQRVNEITSSAEEHGSGLDAEVAKQEVVHRHAGKNVLAAEQLARRLAKREQHKETLAANLTAVQYALAAHETQATANADGRSTDLPASPSLAASVESSHRRISLRQIADERPCRLED